MESSSKETTNVHNNNNNNNNSNNDDNNKRENISFIQKLWSHRKYFIIEPIVLCWLLPSCFNIISIQNLGLEKACRVNLGYPKLICDYVIDKTKDGIDCDSFTLPDDDDDDGDGDDNNSVSNSSNITNNVLNITELLKIISSNDFNQSSLISIENFNYTTCKIDIETQKQVTFINGIRGPLASIFPIIVILFAGGWSDKKGLRKPCMLFPMIGETLAATALLISAFFMESIPMEFGTILERVLPAMFGGQTLMIMGIYSYLTASTPEQDRTFRFGIFAIFANIVPVFGIPFSGTLYTHLGYVYVFLIADILFILGIIYIIFYVDEIKTPASNEITTTSDTAAAAATAATEIGKENLAFELNEIATGTTADDKNKMQQTSSTTTTTAATATATATTATVSVKKNCLVEFFDPSLAYACLKVFFKKRENNGRFVLILLVCSYFLFIGPNFGELDYLYQFCLISLKWTGEQYSIYSTYSTIIITIGTFLMTGIFSKIFHMSDSMIGFISSVCTVISRPMFAFSKTSLLYYAATTIDMFVSTKAIAIKAIISCFVETEELGRLYSVMGIADAFSGFVFPPIYSYIYSSTIESFPGAFYLFGDVFFIPTGLIFLLTYVLIRRNQAKENENKTTATTEELGENQTEVNGKKIIESTYM